MHLRTISQNKTLDRDVDAGVKEAHQHINPATTSAWQQQRTHRHTVPEETNAAESYMRLSFENSTLDCRIHATEQTWQCKRPSNTEIESAWQQQQPLRNTVRHEMIAAEMYLRLSTKTPLSFVNRMQQREYLRARQECRRGRATSAATHAETTTSLPVRRTASSRVTL